MLRVAVLVPDAVGAKVTFSEQLEPAKTVPGVMGQALMTAKSLLLAPVMVAEEMVRAVLCSLVSVTVCAGLVDPRNCVVNVNEVGETRTG
jgi:hypothetical protein